MQMKIQFPGFGAFVIAALSLTAVANELPKMYSESAKAMVIVRALDPFGNRISEGSGFKIGVGDRVVTNFHVVRPAYHLEIETPAGASELVDFVVAIDSHKDLAVIPTTASGAGLVLAQETPSVGDKVYAIGAPMGLEHTLSDGIVSGVRYVSGVEVIQTTTSISSGSSGGPLLSFDNTVVGVVTWTLKQGQNLNFAVSSQELTDLIAGNNRVPLSDVTKRVDRSDPRSVAVAFFAALRRKDSTAAAQYVFPEERDYFASYMRTEGFPTLPEFGEIEVSVGGEKKTGLLSAEVGFVDEKLGVDMVFTFDQWWIIK